MESKKELYHAGANPNFYEAFDDDTCTRLIMALEELAIPYTRVPHIEVGIKSLRFYVDNKDASEDVLTKADFIYNHLDDTSAIRDLYRKYELVYENSFV